MQHVGRDAGIGRRTLHIPAVVGRLDAAADTGLFDSSWERGLTSFVLLSHAMQRLFEFDRAGAERLALPRAAMVLATT